MSVQINFGRMLGAVLAAGIWAGPANAQTSAKQDQQEKCQSEVYERDSPTQTPGKPVSIPFERCDNLVAIDVPLKANNVEPDRITLIGFSQGGCLALEFAARNARRFDAVIVLSAGLIGQEKTPRDYAGSLADTPVHLGCSDIDPHVPVSRVRESSRVLSALGAEVANRIYPGMGREINDDEVDQVHARLSALVARS
ncbi:dienelactone hydrolase family protein [Bradyrhizobium sp. NBAIM14]|uniref:alpha/beta hydrolase n=1 Tax=Bradyrhizobium sp. NBAIM14 TaxID=2793814 RepID=UPI001CD7EFEE|nr:dienelactone hydrolase family protein [Bradyrhizobium sp. NBAIM14]MCA1500079.1 dienelactone hydrolase family protein [Bradyrhizobium sp. NBAIM14]